ncbi:MAG TPA: coproporphyrinogen III oxidase family protein [Campylobacterales bacterium]|nr:coproporphyrinogen III oxidase family protein [Campylobacterales bacterium]
MLLYIHIPYCDSKCHYCSFNSYVDRFDTRERYMRALLQQLEFEVERFEVKNGEIESLFIGGGTPSTVDPRLYAPLFETLRPLLAKGAEITSEANPNSASPEWLKGMYSLGVNRLSFGVQSFDPAKLKALNRAHSPKDALQAIKTAHAIGFEHLSLDLIYNYQGDTPELLGRDIEQAFQLPIDHISAYELTIESQTQFATTPEVRQENDSLAFFVAKSITQRGFAHYEISNFGTHFSRHNRGYWQLKDYMGIGAGAVGFLKDRRYYPTTDIEQYIDNPLRITEEPLNSEERLTERIFLGLRSDVGLHSHDLSPEMLARCDFLVREGKLEKEHDFYQNRNFFLADEIALYVLG